jgi:trigger factor
MEITITEAGPSKKNVKIVIAVEEIQNKYQEKIVEIRDNYPIKGFRAGKVPNHLIEKKFGKNIIEELKIGFIWDGYRQLLDEHKLELLRDPEIKPESILLQRNQPCTIEFTVEVFPEFKLPEYKGVEVQKPEASVAEKDVEMALEGVRKMRAELIVTENAVSAENDLLICDANLKVGEKLVWGNQNMSLEVEDSQLMGIAIPKSLFAGHKEKDVVLHKVTLPADFHIAEHANQQGEFSFVISEIKKIKLPELNDEFAKLIGAENLETLKKNILQNILTQREAQLDYMVERQIVEKLMAQVNIVVPENFIAERLKQAYEETRHHLLHEGKSEEEIKAYLEKEATHIQEEVIQDIKESLLLEKIARLEKIEVNEEDMDAYISAVAHQRGKWPNELRAEYEKKGMMEEVKYKVKTHKVLFMLQENAKVVPQPHTQQKEP